MMGGLVVGPVNRGKRVLAGFMLGIQSTPAITHRHEFCVAITYDLVARSIAS